LKRCPCRNSAAGQVPQQPDIDTRATEVARGGELPDFSGDAAQQLEAFVFGSVSGRRAAERRGVVQPAGEILAGVMRESVEQGHRAQIRLKQTRFEGHDFRIGQKPAVFRKDS